MLVLYLFNLTGYPLLFNFLIDQANKRLTVQLDENRYDESQLHELKIPLHSPYITGNNTYERFEGQAEVNGVKYSYVKRKVFADTLYLQYIPDAAGTKLLAQKGSYAKHSIDLPSEKKQTAVKKGGPCLEYNNGGLVYSFCPIATTVQQESSYPSPSLPQSLIATQEQPPDVLSSHIL